MLTDPIADMLTRIRNANLALHDSVEMPASRLKAEVARVLAEEGYITDFVVRPRARRDGADGAEGVEGDGGPRELSIRLKYDAQRRRVITGLRRESTPGRRVYVDHTSIPRVLGGMGVAVISTSRGVITGHEARRRGVGGEVLCTVW